MSADIDKERAAFEAKFPVPSNTVWTGKGYAPTAYNAWSAVEFCNKWVGWQAARATPSPAPMPERQAEPTDAQVSEAVRAYVNAGKRGKDLTGAMRAAVAAALSLQAAPTVKASQ